LKYLTGSFTIEVSDSNGILNSTNYWQQKQSKPVAVIVTGFFVPPVQSL
jgi:hypothetical protein